MRPRLSVGVLTGLGALALVLAGCSSSPSRTVGPTGATKTVTPAVLTVPLSASTEVAANTWAAVPMGRLSQPDNTFWQLFVLPSGRGRWRLVTPAGVADNGGMTLSSAAGGRSGAGSLVVGFEASQLLGFSPLAATASTGRRWQPGTVPSPIAASPGSLAEASDGTILAVTAGLGGAGTQRVEASTNASGGTGWRTLTTGAALAGSRAGRRCGLERVEAVGFASTSSEVLVGGACSSADEVGVFAAHVKGGTVTGWALVGAPVADLPPTEAVRFLSSGKSIDVLAAERLDGRTRMVVLSIDAGRGHPLARAHWTVSGALVLPGPGTLVSTGTVTGGGFVVVFDDAGIDKAAVLAATAHRWKMLPPLPSGTATVAFGAGGRIDALVVRLSQMLDYRLHRRRSVPRPWYLAQVIDVPIQYGSSG